MWAGRACWAWRSTHRSSPCCCRPTLVFRLSRHRPLRICSSRSLCSHQLRSWLIGKLRELSSPPARHSVLIGLVPGGSASTARAADRLARPDTSGACSMAKKWRERGVKVDTEALLPPGAVCRPHFKRSATSSSMQSRRCRCAWCGSSTLLVDEHGIPPRRALFAGALVPCKNVMMVRCKPECLEGCRCPCKDVDVHII